MPAVRVRLGFRNASDQKIVEMAEAVIAAMTGNVAFPKPAVALTLLRDALNEFKVAISKALQGGRSSTAIKYNKRDALKALLRKQARYVEDNCENDLPKLLSSGFVAKNLNRAPSPLPKATILSLGGKRDGQILIQVRPSPTAKVYEARFALAETDGSLSPWQDGGKFRNSRAISLDNLLIGRTYAVQVRAFGSTGFGEWSDPVYHVCRPEIKKRVRRRSAGA